MKNYIITLYKPISVNRNTRVFIIEVGNYTNRTDGFVEIFDDEAREVSIGLISSTNVQSVLKATV